MFSNLLQSLEPAMKYRCCRHSESAIQSVPWPGPSLPPRGGLSFTGTRVSVASLSQSSSKKDLISDVWPGRNYKGNGPCSGDDDTQHVAVPGSPQPSLQVAHPRLFLLPRSSLDMSISGTPQPFRNPIIHASNKTHITCLWQVCAPSLSLSLSHLPMLGPLA